MGSFVHFRFKMTNVIESTWTPLFHKHTRCIYLATISLVLSLYHAIDAVSMSRILYCLRFDIICNPIALCSISVVAFVMSSIKYWESVLASEGCPGSVARHSRVALVGFICHGLHAIGLALISGLGHK